MQQDERCLLDHTQLLQLEGVAIGQEVSAWTVALYAMVFVLLWIKLEPSVPTVQKVSHSQASRHDNVQVPTQAVVDG